MMRALLTRMPLACLILLLGAGPGLAASETRLIAEWEPAQGALIVWPLAIPCELVVALAAKEHLWVLVANASVKADAADSFRKWQIPTDKVTFILSSVESQWTRDYGPHQIFDEQGRWTMLDSIYINTPIWALKSTKIKRGQKLDYFNQTFPGDDRTNEDVAAQFKVPLRSIEGYLTGGNFLVDGHGTAFATRALLDENNVLMSDDAFREMVLQFAGIKKVVVLENTEAWGIQHIDCFLKLLDEETLLVKQVPIDHPEYEPIRRNLAILSRELSCYGRPYRIFRIQCPPYRKAKNFKSGKLEDWVPAYTNSLILNQRIYVPLFNCDGDQTALETYRTLMPGYEVIGFPSAAWYPFDALHCRTRAIFDPHMVRLDHQPLRDIQPANQSLPVKLRLEDHFESRNATWKVSLIWRDEKPFSWEKLPLSLAHGSYSGSLPALPKDKTIVYYLLAESSDGRSEFLPRSAPQGLFSFKTNL